MAKRALREQLELPAGVAPRQVVVTLDIVAPSYTGDWTTTVAGAHTTTPDASGLWQLDGVRPTEGDSADALTIPDGAAYRVTVTAGQRTIVPPRPIRVPDSTEPDPDPLWVGDLLVTLPDEIPAGARHATVIERDAPDAHPIAAISGLDAELDGLEAAVAAREPFVHGRQHVDTMRSWAAALGRLQQSGDGRVLLIADSIGELSSGFAQVQEAVQDLLVGKPAGFWWPANANPAIPAGWPTRQGTTVDIGLDRRGLRMGEGDEAGISGAQVASARRGRAIRLWYTARPDGGTVDVSIDGVAAGTIDTTLDTAGDPVAVVTPAQVWTSDPLDPDEAHRFYLDGVQDGPVDVEAAQWLPERGLVWHGRGRSGIAAAEVVAGGDAVAHLASMVALDEPPDLVVVDVDTADSDTLEEHLEAMATLVAQIRDLAPLASIVRKIPPGHNNRTDWPEWAAAFAQQNRELGLVTVDALAALGDISTGVNPHGFGSDGTHFSALGSRAHQQTILDVLLSRTVRPVPAAVAAQVQQILTAAGGLAGDITALQTGKVDRAGDTMTGDLGWDSGNTRIEIGPSSNPLATLIGGGDSLRSYILDAPYPFIEVAGGSVLLGDGTEHPSMRLWAVTPNRARFGSSFGVSLAMARHRLAVTTTPFTIDTALDTGHQGRLIDVQVANCTLTLAGRTGTPVPILDLDIINTSSTPCTIVAAGGSPAVHVVAGKVAQIPPNGRARAVSTGTNVWRLSGDLVDA